MSVLVKMIRIAPRLNEAIDYSTVIFKLDVTGPLNFESSEEVATVFKTVIAGGAIKLIIDLSGTHLIDSSGIGILINSARQIRDKNGDLALLRASDEVSGVIRLTNLQRIINIFPTEDEAVSYLSSFVKHNRNT